MANPVKGELEFEANGQRYTFVLGTYALAALQRRTGMSTSKFFGRKPTDWGVDDLLAVFHSGLLRHHKLSEEEAADLVDVIGQVRVGEIINEGVLLGFPEPKKEAATSTARPPKTASSSTTRS